MQTETLSGWLSEFSALHERAKQGALSPEERTEYIKACDELAEALLTAQQSRGRGGAEQRRSLRVAQALPLELVTGSGRTPALTLDVSTGGFSTILSEGPELGSRVGFKLKIGRGWEPVSGTGRVVNAVPQNGSVRVGIRFEDMEDPDRERLGFVIVDAVLRQFGRAA